jgi:hypothetical protein
VGGHTIEKGVASSVLPKLHGVDILNISDESFGGWDVVDEMHPSRKLSSV